MPSGKSSRAKGVAGERESADVFRRHGFEVVRLQNNVLDAGDYTATMRGLRVIPGGRDFAHPEQLQPDVCLLVDAKRRERLNMLSACKQIEAVARDDQLALVVWRANREPWRFSGLLEPFARLLGTT